MHHYFQTLFFIVKKRHGRFNLLKAYLKIILRAHWYHKVLRFFDNGRNAYFDIVLLGMSIRFFSYPSLLHLFEEIFIKEIYFFESLNNTPFIIDCGSNIGLSVLYFKKKYPASLIIAFEPDNESFDLLSHNVESNYLSGITLKKAGLSAVSSDRIFFKTKNENGSVNNSLFKSGQHDASVVIKSELLSDHISQPVDFLKIDTEGAEGEILQDLFSSGKINMISQIFIEYHQQCDTSLAELEKGMIEYGFKSYLPDAGVQKSVQIIYKRGA